MISWRYHVVSIVAVVLAFGLGILAGTSVLNDRFVIDLQRNYDEAQRQRNAAQAEVSVYELFALQLRPILRDGVLIGDDVVVVTVEGLSDPARRVVDELIPARADMLATIELTRRLVGPDGQESLPELQRILGTTSSDGASLRTEVAETLADRLAFGADPVGEDVLAELLAAGFVTADRDLDNAALQEIGGVGQTIVLAAGGVPPSDLPAPDPLPLRLAEGLVIREAPVAVAGPREDEYALVRAVREDSGIPDCSVVTVDDIDLPIGGIALVMGIDRLLDDPDPQFLPGGDYGIEVDAIVPGDPPASCRR